MAHDNQLQQYRFDRSKSAADAANANSRAMAQASVLINGAAATAVIALLSKERIDPVFLKALPTSLTYYAVGALLAWAGMFTMTECLDLFSTFREEQASGSPKRWRKYMAYGFWWTYRSLYAASALCFIIASVKLAIALSNMNSEIPSCIPV
jgi:hypothetical protein